MRSKPLSIPSIRNWSSCRGSEALIHVLVGCALAAAASSVRAEERLALVIGVAEYDSVTPLENPVNDAVAVSDVLGQLGFDVTLGIDVDREAMLAHVEAFAEKAQSADVTLFYFAGHGFQIDGENYLIPADAAYRARADLAEQSVTLGRITGLLDGGAATHLVVLDACRNNPFEELLGADERRAEDGLARVENAAGFLFAFATQPGQLAWDGEGRPNSYFTGALLNHMQVTGQDIGSALISVRRDVIKATGGEQVPWQTSSLTEQFYFRPGEPEVSPEAMLWRTAAQTQDVALLAVYLDRYPIGIGAHAEDARQLLDDFTGRLDVDRAPRSVASGEAEEELWRVTSRLRSVELAELYRERFPLGRHFEEAGRLIDLRSAAAGEGADAAICERLATHPRDATADLPGVPLQRLRDHAEAAIAACARAAERQPELPHLTGLLARSLYASGQAVEALQHYRAAAAEGDLRAILSLAMFHWSGEIVPKDPGRATELWERAAEGGHAEGAINLATATFRRAADAADHDRVLSLLRDAAAEGWGAAAYNLGALALEGKGGSVDDALTHFERAIELGYQRGYYAMAVLQDSGEGAPRDRQSAADKLLRGAVLDDGQVIERLGLQAARPPSAEAFSFSAETIEELQERLAELARYDGPTDGMLTPEVVEALERHRLAGGRL